MYDRTAAARQAHVSGRMNPAALAENLSSSHSVTAKILMRKSLKTIRLRLRSSRVHLGERSGETRTTPKESANRVSQQRTITVRPVRPQERGGSRFHFDPNIFGAGRKTYRFGYEPILSPLPGSADALLQSEMNLCFGTICYAALPLDRSKIG